MRPEISRTLTPAIPLHRRFFPIPKPASDRRGLFADEPETCRRSVRQFLSILAHLGLLLAVFCEYHVEGPAFRMLVAMTLAALPVHYAVPLRFKKPLFVAVSIVGLGWIFGLTAAAIVVALGLSLIALSRLPTAWTTRVAVLMAVGLILGVTRAWSTRLPVPDTVWPVLGSMFIFRMILYLYELKHAEGPESFTDALAYFFLLPNLCFVHFPVVDYRSFRRGYFAQDIHATQATGLRMMARGTVHLLAYRLVYHELLIPAEEVRSLATLLGFLVCNYLLYLRVSGQFHMACGMLHLFGFSLPPTHNNYLLATSFTDYWRRINIYWKDFMIRVVFNPVVFRLKHYPQSVALALATATVFFATWILHAYQMFWRWGSWKFSTTDALFWGVLGVLVLINIQLEARAPRRSRGKAVDTLVGARSVVIGRVLMIAGALVTFGSLGLFLSELPSLSDAFSSPSALFAAKAFYLGIFVGVGGLLLRHASEAGVADRAGSLGIAKAMSVHGLKTVATFATIAVLWSLWYSPSVGTWLAMMRRAALSAG